jgi:PAS domain S-box-containing protein
MKTPPVKMRSSPISKKVILLVAALYISGAFILHLVLPPGYIVWILFLFALVFVARVFRPGYIFLYAGIVTFLAVVDLFNAPLGVSVQMAFVNRLAIILVLWILTIILIQRRHESEVLHDQKESLRAILDAAVDGIITIDERGIIQSVNPAVTRIFGYPPEEMINQNVNMLMPGPFHDEHDQYLRHYLETNEKKIIGIGREVMGKRKDGSVFPLDLAVSEVNLNNQRMFTGLLRDITKRKQTEEELNKAVESLTRSNAELEQFAYVASHDLQEPLRMIASYVQLLQKRYQSKLDKEADEFINYATDGARRMQLLIEDLLTFSRVGTQVQAFKALDLAIVLNLALDNLQLAIRENNAVITFEALPQVNGDESQLVQVFQNLLDNALKFRKDRQPCIHVSAQNKLNYWLISVQDNGIGIDPKYFDRIFLVFQRLHSKAKYPGTGIGLAICKKIIERHGGKIWVETEPGMGSRFQFTLPR